MKKQFCRAECSATPRKLEWDILARDRRSFMMGCEEFSLHCAAEASLDVACRRAGERSLVELRWSPQGLPRDLAVLASFHSELAAFHAIIALQVAVVRFWVRLCAGDRAAARIACGSCMAAPDVAVRGTARRVQGAIDCRTLLDGAALADVVGRGKADLRSLAESIAAPHCSAPLRGRSAVKGGLQGEHACEPLCRRGEPVGLRRVGLRRARTAWLL